MLSPVALAIVFWYSLAKRYTAYTQLFLGLAMAVAPVGGWIAAGGGAGPEPWLLGMAIGLWVGGFDILYACQDVEFDRGHGLLSIPTRFGVRRSILFSRVMHVATVSRWSRSGALRICRRSTLSASSSSPCCSRTSSRWSVTTTCRSEEGVRPERIRGDCVLPRDRGVSIPSMNGDDA
jgi:hypothetical protein